MKLLYLLRLPMQIKPPGFNEFHTSAQHKHDQADGCEFLDESIHMHEEPLADTELGEY